MKIITVEKKGLLDTFAAWGVKLNYARFFLEKCEENNGRVALSPFMFNDTVHLTNPHQWLAANTAFWVRAYQEAQTNAEQVEAIGSIRALFFLAGSLGAGQMYVLIGIWFEKTRAIHGLDGPNISQLPTAQHKSDSAYRPTSFH